MIKILGIRENPELLEAGAKFFHGAFGNKDNYMLWGDSGRIYEIETKK